ncbi:MAG: hypothetical protein PHH16_04605 [Candidatus Gracilibacteria bacterium]|nr:hypothetical protein [Candidatus Gracilibacteria bacterium]
MFLEEKHSRSARGIEEDLWIDLSILSFLREEILSGNLDFVSLRGIYKQGFFSDLDCSWERFRRRAFYQVGLGFVDVHPVRVVESEKGEENKANKQEETGHKQTRYLPPLRITAAGFMRIPELEKEVKKYEGINRYITKWKKFLEETTNTRGAAIIGITGVLILSIFVFNIKVSKIIDGIPLLNSVINTKILAEFEAINTQDAFYQAMMSDSGASPEGSSSSSDMQEGGKSTIIPASAVIIKPAPKNIPIPSAIQNILPEKTKIEDVTVQNISPTEKLFKINLDNGATRYIQVKKEGGNYVIAGK